MPKHPIHVVIEWSSFGTRDAVAARRRTPPEVRDRILQEVQVPREFSDPSRHTAPTTRQAAKPVRAGGRMADRRAGPNQGPYVPSPGGGTQPRDRNNDGTWRKKRSDARKPRKK